MNEKHKEIAQAFIKQYNLRNSTDYKFETVRRSMFEIPKFQFPSWEFYQISFIKGKKINNPYIADLMVLLRIKKRMIIEVAEARGLEGVKKTELLEVKISESETYRHVEHMIYSIEFSALNELICSQYLLIDGRNFGSNKISNPDFYKEKRFDLDRLLKSCDEREKRELEYVAIPTKHWFKEIWLLHYDEKSTVRCLQIW